METTLRIYTYNENCGQAGRIVSQEDIENDDQHTNEGDDYSGDYSLHEGTRDELIKYNLRELEIKDPRPGGAGMAFRHRVARNILEYLDYEPETTSMKTKS